jgi:hypothetical protein
MVALLTARDRQVYALQREIERERHRAYSEANDERAMQFHLAKIAMLESELGALMESNQ